MLTNRKSGFAPLVIIIAVVVLAGGSTYFYTKKKSADTVQQTAGNNQQTQSTNADSAEVQKIISEIDKLKKSAANPESVKAWSSVPKSRKINAGSDTRKYATTTAFNVEFKTPWGKGTVNERTKNSTVLKQIEFKNGKSLLISINRESVKEELSNTYDKEVIAQLEAVMSEKLNSGYEFMNYIYSSTPEQITLNTRLKEAQSISRAVILKTVMLPSLSQIYSFEKPGIKGFQFGEYTNADTNVTIHLFTEKDVSYTIMMNKQHKPSQKDIDVILSTFTVK
jgi:hypothetical protein